MVSQPIANMAAFLAVRLAQRRNVRERRVFGERMLIAGMRDIDFISKYRLDRTGVEDLLQLVGNDLVKEDRGGHAIPPETQLLASLRFLSKGAFYSEIADSHGVSKSSISRFMPKVVESLNTHLDNIKFPTERDELLTTKREFFAKCHFPNIGGAIDGTLIPIVAPTRDEEAFVCRKGFHAINCQAVVGPDLRFTDIVARWPGSTHDAGIFDNSNLKDYLEEVDNVVLLGDSGYPLRKYLLTPVLNPRNNNEERYNRRHKRGRHIVERAFGLLKLRFRDIVNQNNITIEFKKKKATKRQMSKAGEYAPPSYEVVIGMNDKPPPYQLVASLEDTGSDISDEESLGDGCEAAYATISETPRSTNDDNVINGNNIEVTCDIHGNNIQTNGRIQGSEDNGCMELTKYRLCSQGPDRESIQRQASRRGKTNSLEIEVLESSLEADADEISAKTLNNGRVKSNGEFVKNGDLIDSKQNGHISVAFDTTKNGSEDSGIEFITNENSD